MRRKEEEQEGEEEEEKKEEEKEEKEVFLKQYPVFICRANFSFFGDHYSLYQY
jgi:hypothetical protein